MTLEKLLILGFALALMYAITVVGKNMMEDHEPRYGSYTEGVDDLIGLTTGGGPSLTLGD